MRTADRFSTITVEGAILPPDLLKRVADNSRELDGLSADSYMLAGEKLNEAISRAWSRARTLWANFRDAKDRLPATDDGTRLTRDKWLLPLFKELDYGLLAAAHPYVFDEKAYPVSHEHYSTLIHLVGFRQDLDKRAATATDGPKMSPHGLVQELLNRSKGHLWAFVSNGLQLRILRDSAALTRHSFVEFDLEAMLRDEVYPDFVLFWMLCHASRVRAERPEECWLEKWSKAAQAQGTRALDQLRDGVEKAITALGQGFLQHPENRDLRAALERGALTREDYYRQLLRLVYRLIFLFVAEDRDLLLMPAASVEAKARFRRFYGTQRLRAVARTVRGTPHGDLWQTLVLVMGRLGHDEGCPDLGLPALGSFLWSLAALGNLHTCQIGNRAFLDAIRALDFTEDHGVRRFVDYRNLGAEELGSIYESLLELFPDINLREGGFLTSRRQRQRAQEHGQLLHAHQPGHLPARLGPGPGAGRGQPQARRRSRHPGPQGRGPRLRLRPLPDRRCPPHRQASGLCPNRQRRAQPRRHPPRPARRDRPLHPRRRHQRDGRRAVQGQPVDGGA